MIATIDVRCQSCHTPLKIPLKHDWSSPLYVMQMEKEHEWLKRQLAQMQQDLLELAKECVEAGVRPSILRRADETKRLLEELKQRYWGEEPDVCHRCDP